MTKTDRNLAVVIPSLTNVGCGTGSGDPRARIRPDVKGTVVTMEPRLASRDLRELTVQPRAERVPPGCPQVYLPSTGSGVSRMAPLVVRFAAPAQQHRFDAVYSFLTWTNILVAAAKGPRWALPASPTPHAANRRGADPNVESTDDASDGARHAVLDKCRRIYSGLARDLSIKNTAKNPPRSMCGLGVKTMSPETPWSLPSVLLGFIAAALKGLQVMSR